jgi:acyl carrier protein
MNTLDKVIAIIRNNISTDAGITADTDMRKDLAVDSFDGLMIMNEIDDAFGISVDEDDFKKVNTPGEIVNLLQEQYGIHESER